MADVKIQRGATEHLTVNVDQNLTGYTCILSIGSEDRPCLSVDNEQMEMTIVDGKSKLVYTLTQEQTLSLKKGTKFMQLRAINGETAVAWPMTKVEVLPVINDGVITDEF